MRHELSKIFKCHYVFLSSYCTKSHDWLCHINCKRRRAVSFSSLFLEQDIKRVVYDCPLITTYTLYVFAGNYTSYIIIYHWYNRGFFCRRYLHYDHLFSFDKSMARHMNMGNCMVRKFTNVNLVNKNIKLISLCINRLYHSYIQLNIEIISDIFSVNIEYCLFLLRRLF